MRIRVLITDDHAVLRAGLRLLINAQPDMEVVGEATNGQEALHKVRETAPDVVLMDLAMAGQIDIPAIAALRETAPSARVLVLSMYTESGYVRAAMAAGAAGYVVKSAADTDLLTAIRAASQGRTFVHFSAAPETASSVLGGGKARRPDDAPGMLSDLSTREREVFGLVARGYTNRQIADQLGVSIKSVEAYRSRLMSKLGLSTRADLVRYAVDCGVLKPGKGNS